MASNLCKSVRIRAVLLVFFVGGAYAVQAQKGPTMELKPIHHKGFSYYYDFKKVDGGPYALQIPLQALNDEEINKRYKRFRTYRTLEGVMALAPLIYLFYIAYGNQYTTGEFWPLWFGAFSGIVILEIVGQHQLKLGIDRYNQLILAPRSGRVGPSLTFTF